MIAKDLRSENEITTYRDENRLVQYEPGILDEILTAVKGADAEKINWFNQFGDSFRSIIMNVHSYRQGCLFGFNEISLDSYGWLTRPDFQEKENLIFGNPERYGEHSILHIGRGVLPVWTYALSCSYGTAGGGWALSVHHERFAGYNAAVEAGLSELKEKMQSKIGNTDTTNFKQTVILGTLRDISKFEIRRVQLSLF